MERTISWVLVFMMLIGIVPVNGVSAPLSSDGVVSVDSRVISEEFSVGVELPTTNSVDADTTKLRDNDIDKWDEDMKETADLTENYYQGNSWSGSPDDSSDVNDYADIQAVYHLDKDTLWILFTKSIIVDDDNIEISHTFDFSIILDFEIVDKTPIDMVLMTSKQLENMEYTIDVWNVIETDGTKAGLISFDFLGFDESAGIDDEAGVTSKVRDSVNGGILDSNSTS